MVHVCVGDAKNPEGVVYEHDGVMLQDPERFPMRRLSTESYVEVKDKKTPGNANFATQWRWYWKNDGRQWIPFETVSQLSINKFQIKSCKCGIIERIENLGFYKVPEKPSQEIDFSIQNYWICLHKSNLFLL